MYNKSKQRVLLAIILLIILTTSNSTAKEANWKKSYIDFLSNYNNRIEGVERSPFFNIFNNNYIGNFDNRDYIKHSDYSNMSIGEEIQFMNITDNIYPDLVIFNNGLYSFNDQLTIYKTDGYKVEEVFHYHTNSDRNIFRDDIFETIFYNAKTGEIYGRYYTQDVKDKHYGGEFFGAKNYMAKLKYNPYSKKFSFVNVNNKFTKNQVDDFQYVPKNFKNINNSTVSNNIDNGYIVLSQPNAYKNLKLYYHDEHMSSIINKINKFEDDYVFFNDMPNNWSTEALKSAVNAGLLKGDLGYLRPNDNLKRSEFAAVIVRMLHLSKKADISNFKDVSKNDWFYNDISKVYAAGIMKGDGYNLNPNSYITREEAFVMISRILSLTSDINHSKSFIDSDAISDWALDSINGLLEKKYINGDEQNKLNPKGHLRRNEFAVMLYNINSKK